MFASDDGSGERANGGSVMAMGLLLKSQSMDDWLAGGQVISKRGRGGTGVGWMMRRGRLKQLVREWSD